MRDWAGGVDTSSIVHKLWSTDVLYKMKQMNIWIYMKPIETWSIFYQTIYDSTLMYIILIN